MGRSFANQAPNNESHPIHPTQEVSGSVSQIAARYFGTAATSASRNCYSVARWMAPSTKPRQRQVDGADQMISRPEGYSSRSGERDGAQRDRDLEQHGEPLSVQRRGDGSLLHCQDHGDQRSPTSIRAASSVSGRPTRDEAGRMAADFAGQRRLHTSGPFVRQLARLSDLVRVVLDP